MSSSDFHDVIEINQQAYQQMAPYYAASKTRENLPTFWLERLESFKALLPQGEILPVGDIGCGPGRDALWFAQQGFHVLAADISEAMLTQARLYTANQPGSERIEFCCMDMHNLLLEDQACAGLWLSASFLHIPKQESHAVLQELRRVLVPGGPLALLVKEGDQSADERYDINPKSGIKRFFAYYRGGELWNFLEKNDLEVIEMHRWHKKRQEPTSENWLAALCRKPDGH